MITHQLNIINPDAFIKAIGDLGCKNVFAAPISSSDFEIPWSATKPIEGFEFPKDFPGCCPSHKAIYATTKDYIDRFPDCCALHRKLLTAKWFDKSNYTGLPEKTLNTLVYTQHHIENRINNTDWYEDITNYIEYSIYSFGQPPAGFGSPVGLQYYTGNIVDFIKVSKEVPQPKKDQLINYIESEWKSKPDAEQTDLNLLISTYKKWLKTFPFEIRYFSHLKQHFDKQMPLLAEKPRQNPYMGLAKAQMVSLKQLFSFLLTVTDDILKTVNAMELQKQGLINNIKDVSIEVINANRRIELEQLSVAQCNTRPQYLKLLKSWFKGEIRYLKEIRPYFTKQPKQENTPSTDLPSFSLQDLQDEPNLFCKAMPLYIAIEHFKVFTNQNSSNGKPFLTEAQLAIFIGRAFCGKHSLPKLHINCGTREKLFIVKRFYQLYSLAASNYESTSQCKLKYVKLLVDNFSNWTQGEIEKNFADKVKRNWR